jgi:ADP-ribose pyrophosphatase YjhB (NUDIX family)
VKKCGIANGGEGPLITETDDEYLQHFDIHDYDFPLTTVDVVVFTLLEERLCVQLVKRENAPYRSKWALPGGFIRVDLDRDLEATARRVLQTKTGAETPYLEQLGAFGNRDRDPRGWSSTIVYFALVDLQSIEGKPFQGRWQPVEEDGVTLPLAFDHNMIVAQAVERLRSKVGYSALPLHLLPERFTLSRCQQVFEIILGQPLEKSAFRKRLRDADIVEQIPDAFERGQNRPAALYRLRPGIDNVFFPGVIRGARTRAGCVDA